MRNHRNRPEISLALSLKIRLVISKLRSASVRRSLGAQCARVASFTFRRRNYCRASRWKSNEEGTNSIEILLRKRLLETRPARTNVGPLRSSPARHPHQQGKARQGRAVRSRQCRTQRAGEEISAPMKNGTDRSTDGQADKLKTEPTQRTDGARVRSSSPSRAVLRSPCQYRVAVGQTNGCVEEKEHCVG